MEPEIKIRESLRRLVTKTGSDVLCLGETLWVKPELPQRSVVYSGNPRKYEGESFDAVYCISGFEKRTNREKDQLVREMIRVLKTGGWLVLCMKNDKRPMAPFKDYMESFRVPVKKYEADDHHVWVECEKRD